MTTKIILIVCMSNTCRSPMAEYLCRDKLSKKNLSEQFSVKSRGVTDAYEKPGSPASPQGVEILARYFNIDLSGHKSALLTAQDIEEAYCIVPVTRSLAQNIAFMFPDAATKIRCLSNDIGDPWHQSVAVYKDCVDKINEMFDPFLEQIANE